MVKRESRFSSSGAFPAFFMVPKIPRLHANDEYEIQTRTPPTGILAQGSDANRDVAVANQRLRIAHDGPDLCCWIGFAKQKSVIILVPSRGLSSSRCDLYPAF